MVSLFFLFFSRTPSSKIRHCFVGMWCPRFKSWIHADNLQPYLVSKANRRFPYSFSQSAALFWSLIDGVARINYYQPQSVPRSYRFEPPFHSHSQTTTLAEWKTLINCQSVTQSLWKQQKQNARIDFRTWEMKVFTSAAAGIQTHANQFSCTDKEPSEGCSTIWVTTPRVLPYFCILNPRIRSFNCLKLHG